MKTSQRVGHFGPFLGSWATSAPAATGDGGVRSLASNAGKAQERALSLRGCSDGSEALPRCPTSPASDSPAPLSTRHGAGAGSNTFTTEPLRCWVRTDSGVAGPDRTGLKIRKSTLNPQLEEKKEKKGSSASCVNRTNVPKSCRQRRTPRLCAVGSETSHDYCSMRRGQIETAPHPQRISRDSNE